jgi:hypothetical protein
MTALPALAVIAHGEMSGPQSFSNPAITIACKAGEPLSFDQVNQMIDNGLKAEYSSSSLSDLQSVTDQELKILFPTEIVTTQKEPAVINAKKYLGKDIGKRIPVYIFRGGNQTYQVSLGYLLTSQGRQAMGLPDSRKLIIFCCRSPAVRYF